MSALFVSIKQNNNNHRLIFINLCNPNNNEFITAPDFDHEPNRRQHTPPCLCRGRFWKACPSDCPSTVSLIRSTTEKPPLLSSLHKLDPVPHPDHADESDFVERPVFTPRWPFYDDRVKDVIVRHRKVYVADKKDKVDLPIHAIDLTIPVKVKNDPIEDLPPPKPVFRMHKYTTIETKPQVEMVPVTTTIIKPVGVSKDQIIEDESL